MKRCTLLLLLALLAGCANNKDPVKPEPNPEPLPAPAYTFIYGDTLNATAQCPQIDIPWPSLANSPWPMAMVNQQGLSRAPWPLLTTGELIWSVPPVHEATGYGAIEWGLSVGPQGQIYTNEGWKAHRAHSHDGDLLWQLGAPYEPSTGSSIGADGTLYCGSYHGLLAVNPDGSIKWVFKEDTYFNGVRPLIGVDGTIYARAVKEYLTLYAISSEGQEIWSTAVDRPAYCVTASPDGSVLYAQGDGGHLLALNAATGAELWRFPLGLRGFGHAAVDNSGNLYVCRAVQDTLRELVSLSPTGQERWCYRVPHSYQNWDQGLLGPTIAYNGYIYAVMLEGGVIALDYEGKLRWCLHTPTQWFWPPFTDSAGDILLLCQIRDHIFKVSESGHLIRAYQLRHDYQLADFPSMMPSGLSHDGCFLAAAGKRILKIQ